jgi:hypothetical protein
MTTTATAPAWIGWHRASKRAAWVRTVEGTDYGDTWSALLDAVAGRPGGECLVLAADTDANQGASQRKSTGETQGLFRSS